MNEIIIEAKNREKRYAVKEDGIVTKIHIEQPQDKTEVGNIYLGRVQTVKSGMNAAFIQIGKEKNGYLQKEMLPAYIHSSHPDKEKQPISAFIREGEQILVQVKKDETGIKGPLLTAILEFSGKKAVFLPEGRYIAVSKKGSENERRQWRELAKRHLSEREGLIVRTEAFETGEEELLLEVEELRTVYHRLLANAKKAKVPELMLEKSKFAEAIQRDMKRLGNGTIYADSSSLIQQLQKRDIGAEWSFSFHQKRENIFRMHHLEQEIQKALKRVVWLENGSYIVMEETEAAVVIDVNTGKFTGKQEKADTVVKTNIAAAEEIGRQLRLRDYAGMILIDFIDMKSPEDKKRVRQSLEEALKKDSKQIKFIGFTPLGIFELTRKRTRQPLSGILQTPCQVCGGTGKVDSPETAAFRLERELWELPAGEHEAVLVECDEATRRVFSGPDNGHLARLEKVLQLSIHFSIIPSPKHEYAIRRVGSDKDIQSMRSVKHG